MAVQDMTQRRKVAGRGVAEPQTVIGVIAFPDFFDIGDNKQIPFKLMVGGIRPET